MAKWEDSVRFFFDDRDIATAITARHIPIIRHLLQHSWWSAWRYVLLGNNKNQEGWSILLTGAYVVFILYETLMFRETGNARTNFVLFSYAGNFLKEQSVRVGVINNIWLFVPLGTGLYRIFQKKWVLVVPLVFSVLIEATQYITGLGIAEFDDVFGNTLGGWIGVVVTWTWVKNKAMRTTRWKI